MQFKKNLIRPPVLHPANPQEDRHATWLELFYDLMFAAAISHLADALSKNYSFTGLMAYLFLFFPVWWAWVGQTLYLSRFDSDDLSHRFLAVLQMIAIALLIVHIRDGLHVTSVGFALSYAVVRLLLVLQYALAGFFIQKVRTLTTRYAVGFGIAALLWALSVMVPPPYRLALWGVACIIDILTPLTAGVLHIKFPPSFTHLPERFAVFVLIVLGESLVDVIIGIDKSGLHLESVLVAILGLLIAFSLWWVYFDGFQVTHAFLKKSKHFLLRHELWLYAHLPICMAIPIVSVGIECVIGLKPGEALQPCQSIIVCGALAITQMALLLVSFSLRTDLLKEPMLPFVMPHAFVALGVFGLGFIGHLMAASTLISLLAIFCLASIILTLREEPIRQ